MGSTFFPAAWGARLCLAMKARGLEKLCALAVCMQVSESAISRWRKGGPVTLENAVLLCSTLDISLDWLLLGRGEMDAGCPGAEEHVDHPYQKLPFHLRDKLDAFVTAIVESG